MLGIVTINTQNILNENDVQVHFVKKKKTFYFAFQLIKLDLPRVVTVSLVILYIQRTIKKLVENILIFLIFLHTLFTLEQFLWMIH